MGEVGLGTRAGRHRRSWARGPRGCRKPRSVECWPRGVGGLRRSLGHRTPPTTPRCRGPPMGPWAIGRVAHRCRGSPTSPRPPGAPGGCGSPISTHPTHPCLPCQTSAQPVGQGGGAVRSPIAVGHGPHVRRILRDRAHRCQAPPHRACLLGPLGRPGEVGGRPPPAPLAVRTRHPRRGPRVR